MGGSLGAGKSKALVFTAINQLETEARYAFLFINKIPDAAEIL